MEINFKELNLRSELLKAVESLGFETPSPIQAKAIPLVLEGKDILGQAQTGTGKTAAFGLPILNLIQQGGGLQALVMCPTRELAVQVAQEISKLGQFLNFSVLPVYGGQSIEHQLRALHRKPEIIVGTPGRIIDHLHRGTIKFQGLKMVVLDEADEMLDMGFWDDMQTILKSCPPDRQTMLFSATISQKVMEIARTFMHSPALVAIKGPDKTVSLIEQRYYEVNPLQKVEALCRILDIEDPETCLVFCRTKQGSDELSKNLRSRGYSADALHGDLSQRERDSVMQRFRQGMLELLIATDVAARGLDISSVTHVINFDIPQDSDSFIHRTGRTGRAGKEGVAITLVAPRETKLLRIIENDIKKRLIRCKLPTFADALEIRQQKLVEKIQENITESGEEYRGTAVALLNSNDSIEIIATLLKMVDQTGRDMEKSELLPTKPESVKVKIPMGRKHGTNPKKIITFLTSKSRVRPKDIGNIKILDLYSFVDLPPELVNQVNAIFKNSINR